MSGNTITDEDIALFRKSVGAIKPIAQDTAPHTRQTPKPRRLPQAVDRQTLTAMPPDCPRSGAVAAEEKLLFQRPGIQNKTLHRLRRGQFTIEAELDLHGMTVVAATSSLTAFLARCTNSGIRCARIIHGKGQGSKDGKPVIKNTINQWLRQRDEILAFCAARPADGGTGAMYVLIKKTART